MSVGPDRIDTAPVGVPPDLDPHGRRHLVADLTLCWTTQRGGRRGERPALAGTRRCWPPRRCRACRSPGTDGRRRRHRPRPGRRTSSTLPPPRRYSIVLEPAPESAADERDGAGRRVDDGLGDRRRRVDRRTSPAGSRRRCRLASTARTCDGVHAVAGHLERAGRARPSTSTRRRRRTPRGGRPCGRRSRLDLHRHRIGVPAAGLSPVTARLETTGAPASTRLHPEERDRRRRELVRERVSTARELPGDRADRGSGWPWCWSPSARRGQRGDRAVGSMPTSETSIAVRTGVVRGVDDLGDQVAGLSCRG